MPSKSKILLFFTLTVIPLVLGLGTPTIHDHLLKNGLPQGLFPTNITDFTYNPTTGTFTVTFPQPCTAKGENELYFDFNVTGTISYATIGNMSGMMSLELFLWFPVHGIRVDVPSSGILHFDVGVADKKVSAAAFESSPECTAAVVESGGFDRENPLKKPGDELGQRDIQRADS